MTVGHNALRSSNYPSKETDDPRFGALMQGPAHRQLHNVLRYNSQWEKWFADNPTATADDALNFARNLAGAYGFSFNP
jgi:hypothetical protein